MRLQFVGFHSHRNSDLLPSAFSSCFSFCIPSLFSTLFSFYVFAHAFPQELWSCWLLLRVAVFYVVFIRCQAAFHSCLHIMWLHSQRTSEFVSLCLLAYAVFSLVFSCVFAFCGWYLMFFLACFISWGCAFLVCLEVHPIILFWSFWGILSQFDVQQVILSS